MEDEVILQLILLRVQLSTACNVSFSSALIDIKPSARTDVWGSVNIETVSPPDIAKTILPAVNIGRPYWSRGHNAANAPLFATPNGRRLAARPMDPCDKSD